MSGRGAHLPRHRRAALRRPPAARNGLAHVEAAGGRDLARQPGHRVDRPEDPGPQRRQRETRIAGQGQHRAPGDHRRCHRRPVEPAVDPGAADDPWRHGRDDGDPGGCDVDAGGAEAREVRQPVVGLGRRDADDVREGERARVVRGLVHVAPVVAGRRHEEHPGVAGSGDRAAQRLGVDVAAPRRRQDADVDSGLLRTDRPVDRLHRADDRAVTVLVQHLECHQRRAWCDTRHTDPVVADRTDDPGDVGPVAVVVLGRARLVEGVEAVGPVGTKADAEPVGPEVADQIRVDRVDAAVQHADDDITRSERRVPGRFGADSSGLPVSQRGERREIRVVRGECGGRHPVVRLDVADAGFRRNPSIRAASSAPSGGSTTRVCWSTASTPLTPASRAIARPSVVVTPSASPTSTRPSATAAAGAGATGGESDAGAAAAPIDELEVVARAPASTTPATSAGQPRRIRCGLMKVRLFARVLLPACHDTGREAQFRRQGRERPVATDRARGAGRDRPGAVRDRLAFAISTGNLAFGSSVDPSVPHQPGRQRPRSTTAAPRYQRAG